MTTASSNPPSLLAIGGLNLDTIARTKTPIQPGSSNPGEVSDRIGGVAYNVARIFAAQGGDTALIAPIGGDDGLSALSHLAAQQPLAIDLVKVQNAKSGRYVAVEDESGNVAAAIIDGSACDKLTSHQLGDQLYTFDLSSVDWVFADANLNQKCLKLIADTPGKHKLALNAVSVAKARRLHTALEKANLVFCNRMEFDAFGPTPDQCSAQFIITDGPLPLVIKKGSVERSFKVPPIKTPSTTGAGDLLTGLTLFAIAKGATIEDAITSAIHQVSVWLGEKER